MVLELLQTVAYSQGLGFSVLEKQASCFLGTRTTTPACLVPKAPSVGHGSSTCGSLCVVTSHPARTQVAFSALSTTFHSLCVTLKAALVSLPFFLSVLLTPPGHRASPARVPAPCRQILFPRPPPSPDLHGSGRPGVCT